MKIIVLSGKMRSGKSTVADYLIKTYHYNRLSLAAPLKQEVLDLGFPSEDVLAKPPYMRQLLIVLGQARRAINPMHWIDRALANLIRMNDEGLTHFVCDDLRFINELEAFRALRDNFGHKVVFVRVTRVVKVNEDTAIECIDDVSETELDDYGGWDVELTAESGDVDGLLAQAATKLVMLRPSQSELDVKNDVFIDDSLLQGGKPYMK